MKDMITALEKRKRFRDLQAVNVNENHAKNYRQRLLAMKRVYDSENSDSINKLIDTKVNDAVKNLVYAYGQWGGDFNQNRYQYSPNERYNKLIKEIKCRINEIADLVSDKVANEEQCFIYCKEILTKILQELKKHNIAIGRLHLCKSRK